jgi:hypothetical protein
VRLAQRLGISALHMAHYLGMSDGARVLTPRTLKSDLSVRQLRGIERQAGLPATRLDLAVLNRYGRLGWPTIAGVRFCAQCISDVDYPWPLIWGLPYAFACSRHRCLLDDHCPACGARPHSGWSSRTALEPPYICTALPRTLPGVCGADLRKPQTSALVRHDPRLATQQWIDDLLGSDGEQAVGKLRDLHALAMWLKDRMTPSRLERFGTDTVHAAAGLSSRTLHSVHVDTRLIAALATTAVKILKTEEKQLLREVTDQLVTARKPRRGARPQALQVPRTLSRVSADLQSRILAAHDDRFATIDRLRHRTGLPRPVCATEASTRLARRRARFVPQYLWPEWTLRFQPPTGTSIEVTAAAVSAALLVPGNLAENTRMGEGLSRLSTNNNFVLGRLAQIQPDTLRAICVIADRLDDVGSPINYDRRRRIFADVALSEEDWEHLCYRSGESPGRAARRLSARRYLFQFLTGNSLHDRRHSLAFTAKDQRTQYFENFYLVMSDSLRASLHDHAVDWIGDLKLPGSDGDDAGLVGDVRKLMSGGRLAAKDAAKVLGVSIEHVRHAQRLIRTEEYALPASSSGAAELGGGGRPAPSREYLEREYSVQGRSLRDLSAETGQSRRALAKRLKSFDLLPPVARILRTVDPSWLREQRTVLRRPIREIADDLGLSAKVIGDHLKGLGIDSPIVRAGSGAPLRVHPRLPIEIRRAVEGRRHGWTRLDRFRIAAGYPSLSAAAAGIGVDASTLMGQIKGLEDDIGAVLLRRSRGRSPMYLTEEGRSLMALLGRRDIVTLLRGYTRKS